MKSKLFEEHEEEILQPEPTYRLANRIRRGFGFIIALSLLYVLFSLYTSFQTLDEWKSQRQAVLSESVNEWLANEKTQLLYASFALKPRKSAIAGFIENDNHRAIEVLLEELQELYQLDAAFLLDETGILVDSLGVIQSESSGLVSFLEKIDVKPDFFTLDALQLGDSKLHNLEPRNLYVALKVPLFYDVGDSAGDVYILRKAIRHHAPLAEASSQLEQFEFLPADVMPLNLPNHTGAGGALTSLFAGGDVVFQTPVFSEQLKQVLGQVEIVESTAAVRPIFWNAILSSVLPLVLLITVLLYFYRMLMERMLRPVSEMSKVAEQVTYGHEVRLGFMDASSTRHWNEIDVLGVRFNRLMDALWQKQKNLSSLNEQLEDIVQKRTLALTDANLQLEKLAHTDALTGVENRHAFEMYWAALEDKSRRGQEQSIGFAIIDCDHFKGINDTYGHHAGDQVLSVVSQLISKHLGSDGKVFRLGGDEFAVVFEGLAQTQIQALTLELVKHVTNYPGDRLHIKEQLSVSVGVSYSEEGAIESLLPLFRQADTAMYVAKSSLHNKCVIYDDTEHAKTHEELKHENLQSVLEAVKTGEGMVLFYQPIYQLENQQVDYFEVLTRLQIDDEMVFPNVFLPIIERTNLQVLFDKAVIKQVHTTLEAGVLPKGAGVSINLSAESLSNPKVCSWFKPLVPLLEHYKIVIEVTETTLITKLNEVMQYIEQFQQAGFKVALDDFGSGYSSISYLAYLPVDIIKFDISLARVAFQQARSATVVEGLIDNLSEMGYDIVIEGIEDRAMFDMLSQMGASHLQGYYINRPQSVPVFEPAFTK